MLDAVRFTVTSRVLLVLLAAGGLAVAPAPAAGGPLYDACYQVGMQSPEGRSIELGQLCADVEETMVRADAAMRWFQARARAQDDYYLLRVQDCQGERELLGSLERAIFDTDRHRFNMEQYIQYQASAAAGPSRLGQFLAAQHRNLAVFLTDLKRARPENRCGGVDDGEVIIKPPPPPPVKRYQPPLIDGNPVAFRLSWGGSGEKAAQAFCQSEGYSKLLGHEGKSDADRPTWYADTRQPCPLGVRCGLLYRVECAEAVRRP